jgi:hypothetical protein
VRGREKGGGKNVLFSPLGRVDLNGLGGLFSFSFLADVVMTEKILNELSLEKN